jgi:hemoglobin
MMARQSGRRGTERCGSRRTVLGRDRAMNRIIRSVAALALAAPLAGAALLVPADAPLAPTGAAYAKDSLYKRLGGYDAIAAVTDEFIGRLLGDHMFDRFFAGISNDSKGRLRQNIVDFFCKETGGPCYYMGRDMKTVHAGIGITKAEWDKATGYMGDALNKFSVPEQEQKDFVALILPFEKDIVEKP